MIREERRQKIEEYIDSGKKDGAVLATGGGRPQDLPRGYFLQPTIFGGVRNDMRIAREEIFGPVLSVLPFGDTDEAIRIANESTYGLGGAVYTADLAKGLEVAKRIRTGTVNVNGAVSLLHTPFGGLQGQWHRPRRGPLGHPGILGNPGHRLEVGPGRRQAWSVQKLSWLDANGTSERTSAGVASSLAG